MNKTGQTRTLREYDNLVTRVTFGYDTVDDYYRDACSACYIKKVRVPLLCLSALDDPITVAEGIPYDEIRYVWPQQHTTLSMAHGSAASIRTRFWPPPNVADTLGGSQDPGKCGRGAPSLCPNSVLPSSRYSCVQPKQPGSLVIDLLGEWLDPPL